MGLMALRAVGSADVVAACARLRAIAAGQGVEQVACDVSALAAELAAVDALARLALLARRLGCPLNVRRASPELRDLLELCGLADVLGVWRSGRQPEEREQPLDVQERVDPDDPAA
jgi:STAS domain